MPINLHTDGFVAGLANHVPLPPLTSGGRRTFLAHKRRAGKVLEYALRRHTQATLASA